MNMPAQSLLEEKLEKLPLFNWLSQYQVKENFPYKEKDISNSNKGNPNDILIISNGTLIEKLISIGAISEEDQESARNIESKEDLFAYLNQGIRTCIVDNINRRIISISNFNQLVMAVPEFNNCYTTSSKKKIGIETNQRKTLAALLPDSFEGIETFYARSGEGVSHFSETKSYL